MVGLDMAPAEAVDRRYRKQRILSDTFGDFVGRDVRICNDRDLLTSPPKGRAMIFAKGVERPFQRARLTGSCPGVEKKLCGAAGFRQARICTSALSSKSGAAVSMIMLILCSLDFALGDVLTYRPSSPDRS